MTFRMTAEGDEVGVGPGWDYYLDRLVVAGSGGDVSGIDFDAYYPAFSEHYRSELA